LLSEIILATTLALLFLGEKSLWLDEATSITLARDWTSIWPVMLRYNANMWLYYTLLYFWLNLGASEFVVRSLSAIFAIATVPVIYVLGTRLFGAWVGMLAGLLLALNAFFIHYAQEARSYSLLVFLTTLSSYFFVRGVGETSWKHWGGYVITITLALYAHYFGALVLVAHITSLIIPRKEKIPWKGLAISGVATVLLLLPLALFQPLGIGQPTWVQPPEVDDIRRLFIALVGGSRKLLLVYLSLCFVALGFAVARFRGKSPPKIWHYAFLIAWLLAPVVIAFVISRLLRPIFVDRYLIICLPPCVLLTATGLSNINHRWIFAAILTILLILSGRGLFVWYTDYQKENWRDATAFVLTEAHPDDTVYFYLVREPFEYYLGRSDVPSDFLNLMGPDDPPDLKLLESLSDEYTRVWLVLSHDQMSHLGRDVQSRLIQSSLERHYTLTQEQKFKGVRVLLYQGMFLESK
jgi:mannosyltransferase